MADAAIPGISTLGAIFSYAIETEAGTRPTEGYTQLPRCNDISEITLETETIDASALEDYQSRYIAGRQDTGGTWDVTFNFTNETVKIIEDMLQKAAEGLKSSKRTWFQVYFPSLEKAFFVCGQPGTKVPLPAVGQNELLTGAISIAIDEYLGLEDKVEIAPVI